MKPKNLCVAILSTLILCAFGLPAPTRAVDAAVVSWNNLGMHCMDSDYSVFSILPPYNTLEAQLIVGGKLVTNGAGYTLTYQAVADPTGSFNSTAIGKGNFFDYYQFLYTTNVLPPEMGLAGWAMPGLGNSPQSLLFETLNHPAAGVSTPVNWWRAEGIPLSPYDDLLRKNPYPLMRIIAHNGATPIATNDTVLPVSDEMDCRACHASGSYTNTRPAAGWVNAPDPTLDYRLNILRLHDEKQFAQNGALYTNALAARGFNPLGLYQGAAVDYKPALCAACHASEALGAPSYSTIPPLTASVHSQHAAAPDPTLGITLNDSLNRAACYRCHPGSTTRCLRGAMGAAVAPDGSMAMQCQSCHGTMSQVGSTSRVGWFMEPNCQSCHTGSAVNNNGQIRYTSVFTDTNGTVRIPADSTFATQPNTPATGLSLYRFSAGHGGVQCSACHGSTHAEFPSTHPNDNIRNLQLQGHVGVLIECTACHTAMPGTVDGGPHGMHPLGQDWVNRHSGLLEGGTAGVSQCQACHGVDYRGTVLSRAQADRQLAASDDGGTRTVTLYRGAMIGCYLCHNGPSDDNANTSPAPIVSNALTNTTVDQPVTLTLLATGANLTLSIISQPAHGSVGLNNRTATYFPYSGFVGIDTFTFAAYNGAKNSGLGTVTVAVGMVIDTTAPQVRITSPTTNPTYSTTNETLTLGGTATDNVGVTSVTWTNSRSGSGTAGGTTSWSAGDITLQTGANVITVTARDAATNTASDSLTVNYTPVATLTVITNGNGKVTPNLSNQLLVVGRSYTLTAQPDPGWLFTGWSGSISASTPSLTFIFQGGMILDANFIPNPFLPAKGTCSGLYAETDAVRQNSSGAFTVSVTPKGAFSGNLRNGNSRFHLSGQFDFSGHAHAPATRPSMAPLWVDFQLDLTNGTGRVGGTVTDGSWTAALSGDRAVFDAKTNPAPQSGRYTLILPGGDDPQTGPYGASHATISVDKTGTVRIHGSLADRIAPPFDVQAPVSTNGRCPLYLPLYGGRGMIFGWLSFPDTSTNPLSGAVTWFKPATAGATFYPQGFTLETTAVGSRYVPPANGVRLLDLTNASVVLSGGNLNQSRTNAITLNANNQVSGGTNLNLTFSIAKGSFNGSTKGAKPIHFNGVVLQLQNEAHGFFLGTNQSGKIFLGP